LVLTKPIQNNNASIIKYSPQLDGARFLAVLVVIIYHHSFTFLLPTNQFFDLSTFIVFFFALSSYLITKILLVAKRRALEAGYAKTKTALAFLFRRTLRIFPAYYFYILLVLLLPIGGNYLRNHAAVFFFYLSNFQFYWDQHWDLITCHIWTLAVEEQFYLIWPWLILFTPNKHLPKLFMTLIIVGVGFRVGFYFSHPAEATESVTLNVLTPAAADAFGFGALLAYLHLQGKTSNPWIKRAFWISLPIWVLLKLSHLPAVSIGADRIFAAFFALFCIERCVQGSDNPFGRILQSKVMSYLGKISYGIYLYHLYVRLVFWKLFNWVSAFALAKLGISLKALGEFCSLQAVSFIIYLSSSILFAAASWHFLEQPINNWRRKIMYSVPSKTARRPQPGLAASANDLESPLKKSAV
jgi:peptidoglycan/LPS O-acetylase OafA/YrhL